MRWVMQALSQHLNWGGRLNLGGQCDSLHEASPIRYRRQLVSIVFFLFLFLNDYVALKAVLIKLWFTYTFWVCKFHFQAKKSSNATPSMRQNHTELGKTSDCTYAFHQRRSRYALFHVCGSSS